MVAITNGISGRVPKSLRTANMALYFHRAGAGSGPAEVSMSTSRRSSSGWFRASLRPTKPPVERPTK